MAELDVYRKQLDEIDTALVKLFDLRMDIAESIGEYKKEQGLAIRDEERERDVIEARASLVQRRNQKAAQELFELLMGLSRRRQQEIFDEQQ